MKIAPHSKLLMIGDSITDAGRSDGGESTPWENQQGLGHGYVNLINAKIQSEKPEASIRVINRGVGGDTVRDLKNRWKQDVLDYAPDYLSVKIGINDIWRQCDIPLQTETHVLIDEFEETYDELLAQVADQLKGLILITPYVISNDLDDPMRKMIDQYSLVVQALAEKYGAVLVEPQQGFDRYLIHRHASSLAWDSIHPNTTGYMIIANAFWESVSF